MLVETITSIRYRYVPENKLARRTAPSCGCPLAIASTDADSQMVSIGVSPFTRCIGAVRRSHHIFGQCIDFESRPKLEGFEEEQLAMTLQRLSGCGFAFSISPLSSAPDKVIAGRLWKYVSDIADCSSLSPDALNIENKFNG